MGAFDELPPVPRMFQQCTQAGPFMFPRCIGVKSKLYRNGPGALQNHISTHLRQGLSPLARPDVGGERPSVQGGRGSGAMGSMTCFSHSEVVEVVGALDVFRGVPETNSHTVPIMRHHTTLTHRWRARALHQHFQITHAQGRLLYVHTLEVLGCTLPVIHPSFLSQGVYLVMTYGGSPVTYRQSHTPESTNCPLPPCPPPPQLNGVQSAASVIDGHRR